MKDQDKDRYFSTPDNETWCRMGGNGPINVSQIMPLVKFTNDGDSFLDVGCGSGTTLDAIRAIKRDVKYKGLDFIHSRVDWLKKHYPGVDFDCQDARNMTEPDQSWDIVWSRHVVDHMESFEKAIDEQCRVSKKKVICILWYSLQDRDEHEIKPIVYEPITYSDEYLNQYSRSKIKDYLSAKSGWQVIEFLEEVSWQGDKKGKGGDTIIVLERI
jgi:ubiquinone/menaquinone biosynthesis C-methylase UbiE